MKTPGLASSHLAARATISLAACLVPANARPEWLEEWRAELWHVCRACDPNGASHAPRREKEILAFSLGAFQDAWWVRTNDSPVAALPRVTTRGGLRPRTPARCILTLLVIAAACLLLAYARPSVWSILRPHAYRDAHDLVIISRSGFDRASFPTVQLSEYESWVRNSGRLFHGLAFYAQAPRQVALTTDTGARLPLARGSSNLFDLLGVPIALAVSGRAAPHQASLYVSRAVWLKYFHGDAHLFGRVLPIDGQQAIFAGLVEDELWRLPGHTEVWLLEDDRQLSALPPSTDGYVLGLVARHGEGRRQMYVARQDDSYDWFVCEPLAERLKEPFSDFGFALLLAFLALPATTSLPLGDYPVHSSHIPLTTRMRRWAFLALKFGLIVVIFACGSLDVAYWDHSIAAETAEWLELGIAFWGMLLAFRWALRDQRKRCPVCLCTLTHPARVGQFSRNFLAWNGTELVCLSGHGLLHVPDMSTSWFSSQRWLYLDASWRGLFPVGT